MKGTSMGKPLLEVKNIKKKYGDFSALKGVSLTLHEGEIIGLLGVNGAGKTTLSSILATLSPPTEGDVLYQGKSIYDDINGFRQNLGYCQQKPNLNKRLTLRQNLVFAGRYFGMTEDAIEKRIEELSQQLGLHQFLGLKSMVLSGGYKQRFMIARSIIHSPKFVILDEPTVALDPHIRHQLWEQIRGLKKQGICVLLTTHYLDEAEVLSDRVCVLDKGSVRIVDTPQNLMTAFKYKRLEDVFIQLMKDDEIEKGEEHV